MNKETKNFFNQQFNTIIILSIAGIIINFLNSTIALKLIYSLLVICVATTIVGFLFICISKLLGRE